jgi:hypothetical protein
MPLACGFGGSKSQEKERPPVGRALFEFDSATNLPYGSFVVVVVVVSFL